MQRPMMAEIFRQLTAIEETNIITSEQVLFWAKRAEVQRAQKVWLRATKGTKESKGFEAIKFGHQQNIGHKV